jgi:hypothetical protein
MTESTAIREKCPLYPYVVDRLDSLQPPLGVIPIPSASNFFSFRTGGLSLAAALDGRTWKQSQGKLKCKSPLPQSLDGYNCLFPLF